MAQPYSLLAERWIPVLRSDGSRDCIRPAEITSRIADNPVVAPAWGRPDFDAATREFWIGLLATACGERAGEDRWRAWFQSPPTPEDLDAAFAPLVPAFILDGDGPRFGQVPDIGQIVSEKPVAIADLWIDSPAAYFNKDRLNVRLARPAAAISLFALQTYAPEGGRGHYTSMRGGGPLTTLAYFGGGRSQDGQARTLWHSLWLNVPELDYGDDHAAALHRIFPWMAPPDGGAKPVYPGDVHPAQVFWGMPRRIRLDFKAVPENFRCEHTGTVHAIGVAEFRRRPSGIKYENFSHPLSPHRRAKLDDAFRSYRTPKDSVGYRHWVGLVVPSCEEDTDTLERPARSVLLALDRLRSLRASARLHAFGYATHKNKPLAFIESEMPVHGVSLLAKDTYGNIIRRMVAAAAEAERLVRAQVRDALFVKRTQANDGFLKAPKDGGVLDLARSRFWQRTEAAFSERLAALSAELESEDDTLAVENRAADAWLRPLQDTGRDLFDELVPLHDLDALDTRSARARIEARSDLHLALRGYGKSGANLFKALGLSPPESTKRRREPA